MKKVFLLCTMLLALVAGKAQNQQAEIQHVGNTDYVLIPDDYGIATSELDLTDKAAGYSFKVYDYSVSTGGDHLSYYSYEYLLIKVPDGMALTVSGSFTTNGLDSDDDYYKEFLEIYDGKTTNDMLLGRRYGETNTNESVSLSGYSPNMLILLHVGGQNLSECVDLTLTLREVYTVNGFVFGTSYTNAQGQKVGEMIGRYVGDSKNPTVPTSMGIQSYTFAGCELESLTFTNTSHLESNYYISANAFANSGLKEVSLPDWVNHIDDDACNGLLNVIYNPDAVDPSVTWGALARNGQISGDFVLNAAGNTILKYIGDGGEVQIPSTVTAIGDDAFSYRVDIESVDFSLATSLTTIGNSAFYDCDAITEITIPASVTTIGNNAFQYCDYLATVEFSETSALTTIGEYAFASCVLDEIEIPSGVSTIGDNAFEGIKIVNYEGNAGSASDTWGALARNGHISGDFVLDNARTTIVKYIGDGGEVQIPSTVTTIGDDAFSSRDDIESVDFSLATSLTTIGDNAFNECDALTSIAIPASVETIGRSAFLGCNVLESVDLSGATSLTTIDDYAFNDCDALTSIAIPASVETIGYMTFEGCDNLQTVDLSGAAALETIGQQAFYECHALTEITIPASVETIEYGAFYVCYALKSIDLSGATGLKSIGGYAFADCGTISVDVPETVTSIGIYAFRGMPNINYTGTANDDASNNWGASARNGQVGNFIYSDSDHKSLVGCIITHGSVEIPAGVEYIGDRIFKNNVNVSVTIPSSVTSIDYSAFTGVANIINNSNYHTYEPWGATNNNKTIDGDFVYDDNNKTTIVGYIGEGGSIEIPAGVEAINEYAFSGSGTLTAVDFSKTTGLSIGEYAFSGCGLTEVTIPANVSSLGAVIFAGNLNLAVINCEFPMEQSEDVCPNGNWYWKTGGGKSFPVKWQCNDWQLSDDGMLTIKANINYDYYGYYPWSDFRSQIESVEFASNVTAIGVYAFYGFDAMAEITIPSTITEIGDYAFIDCDALTEITIPATVQTMGDEVFSDCDYLSLIYCKKATFPESGWASNWTCKSVVWDWENGNWSLDENGVLTVSKNYEYDDNGKYPWYALRNKIKSVEFGGNVTAIGTYAFYDCDGLTTITIPSTINSMGDYVFCESNNLSTIYCKAETKPDGWNYYWYHRHAWTTDNAYTVVWDWDNGNWNLDENGVLTVSKNYNRDDVSKYPWYALREQIKSVELDNNVTSIGDYEFNSYYGLTSVTIPESVTSIGRDAFNGSYKVAEIRVPTNVTTIGETAFGEIKNLVYYGNAGNSTDTWGAFARNGYVGGDFLYADNTKTYLVAYLGNSGSVTIPSTVTVIGQNAFYDCDLLKSVTIPSSVETIKNSAFNSCDSLRTVDMSNATGLVAIEGSAFFSCDTLASVIIPAGVTSIGSEAFAYCKNMETADMSNATGLSRIGTNMFYECYKLSSVTLPESITEIYDYAFYNCDALTSITIPSGVTYIGDYAFQSSGLTSVTIPENLYTIGNGTFAECSSLQTVDMSEATSLVDIYSNAFFNCDALTSVTIPANVTRISSDAFNECNNLATVDFSQATKLKAIESNAFSNTALESVTLPASVSYIYSYAFSNCAALTTVSIPESIIRVGYGAFNDCDNLSFTTSNGFKYLGNSQNPNLVLIGVTNPSSYGYVSDNVKVVAVGAFVDLEADDYQITEGGACYVGSTSNSHLILAKAESQDISSCTINSNTQIIAPYAFWECYYLSSIIIPESVVGMGCDAVGCSSGYSPTVYCEACSFPEGWDMGWKPYGTANWAYGAYALSGGVLTIKKCINLQSCEDYPWYDSRYSITEIVIENGVSCIGKYAFYNCDALTSITIPSGVTSIGDYAFAECYSLEDAGLGNASGLVSIGNNAFYRNNLATVTIPSNVQSIGDYAFYDNDNLTSVSIPANVQSIGKYGFADCYYLNTVDFSNATSLKIGEYAFYNSMLTKVVIPTAVTEIGKYAFCSNNVSSGLALCEASEPVEGYVKDWTDLNPIWHYNNNVLTLWVNNASLGYVNTISVNGVDVNEARSSATYTYGDEVVIKAVINNENSTTFVRWSDFKTYSERTITITDNLELEAIMGANGSVYNVEAYPNEYYWGTVTGSSLYLAGETVKLTAEAAEHFHFVEWSDGGDDNPRILENISYNYEVEAIFAIDQHQLTLSTEGQGTVSGNGTYDYGSWQNIEATPANGWYFAQWLGGNSNISVMPGISFYVYDDTVLTAVFKKIQEVSAGKTTVEAYGMAINCKFVAERTGKHVFHSDNSPYDAYGILYDADMNELEFDDDSWENGNFRIEYDLVAGETYYIASCFNNGYNYNYYGDMDLYVSQPVSITANATGGEVEGTGFYTPGANVNVNAVPGEGMYFAQWIVNGMNFGVVENKVFVAEEDYELTAVFKPRQVVAAGKNIVEAYGQKTDNCVFTPEVSGKYVFFASSPKGYNTYLYLIEPTEEEWELLEASEDDNMGFSYVLEAGKTYYIGAGNTNKGIEEMELYVMAPATITVEAENGTVEGGGVYSYGTEVTLTAVPATGYHFTAWADGGATTAKRKVTVEEDKKYTALFEINTYTVTVNTAHGHVEVVTENGTTSLSPNPYNHGTELNLKAVADADYKFARWSTSNAANPYSVTLTSNLTLTPQFISASESVYTVTVSASEGGSAKSSGTTFLKNEKAVLIAIADQGYHFVKWSTGSTADTIEYTVTSSATITAQFALNSYELKVLAGANGTVSGGGTIAAGSSTAISATAAEGYHFVKWSDGNTNAERTITMNSDMELTAEFAINTYAVKASGTNGTVEGTGTYNHGAEATLTAVGNTGYHFVKWTDGVETATRKEIVKSDLSFTAEFAINSYAVKVSATNGTVTGEGTYEHGAKAKLTATAAEGYHFTQWSDGLTMNPRTIVVTEELALAAEFEINSYAVRASGTNGTVEGTGSYDYGAEATLTAVGNTGYHFSKWSDGVETAIRKETVKSDLSFTAVFAANSYTISVDSAANGTITGAGTYTYKATATLEAKANKGYHFVMWTDSVMTATRTVEVTGNATFSAVFAGDSYELTVKAKNGTVEGAGTYENGTEATLTAVADAGYIFSKWDDDNTDNPRTVTVTGNKTYTATFKKALYSVTVNAENGQITGAADSLELGATVTLTAIADEGYHFVMWSDSVTENPRTVTLTAELLQQVKDSIEFTAIFEVNTDVADEAVEVVNIFAYGNTIVVENAVSDIFVYNAMGRLIERVAAEAGRTEIKIDGAGIYVVKTGNTAKRVMIND